MPVPSTTYVVHQAKSTGGVPDVSPAGQINIQPNKDIRAHVMLVNVISSGQSQFWGASAYISLYTQDNVTHPNQVLYELQGHNITEIVLTVNALEATVLGAILVEYF